MWLHGLELLKVSHPPTNFFDHKYCGGGDIMVLVCPMIFQDEIMKQSFDFVTLFFVSKLSKTINAFSTKCDNIFFGFLWQRHQSYDFPAFFLAFAGQISYPFDFISWRNLLVEFYGNGRPVHAIFRQTQSQKFKVPDLRKITSNTLGTSLVNVKYYVAHI